jgi:hypothetical protein
LREEIKRFRTSRSTMGKSATNGVNNGTKETIVPPTVVSGIKRQKGLIVSCFLSLSIVYAGIYYMYSPDRMPVSA